MGTLRYGTDQHGHEFEDRTLAHLHLLLSAKLRRGESFMLNWTQSPDQGSGRITLWIAPRVPVMIRFDGSRSPAINRGWLEHLMEASYTPAGVELITETDFEAHTAALR